MTYKPTKYDVLIKQYLRSILGKSAQPDPSISIWKKPFKNLKIKFSHLDPFTCGWQGQNIIWPEPDFSSTGVKWSKNTPSSPSFPSNSTEAGFTAKITLPRFPTNAKYV